MFHYHPTNIHRIRRGELMHFYFTDEHPKYGKALVLVFNRKPFVRPVKPEKWHLYQAALADWSESHAKNDT